MKLENPLVALIDPVLDKIFPDKNKALEAKQKLLELEQAGELAHLDANVKVALAQAAINQEEAKSSSLFKSGWRPAAGWVCVFGLTYAPGTAVLFWLLQVIGWAFGADISTFPKPPAVNTGELIAMLISLLGLGGLRTMDKKNGTA